MMRDSAFLSIQPSSDAEAVFAAVIDSESTNFVHLANIAGLDRAHHFQYANLAGVDFSDCDLRGFDFTGACLVGAKRNANTRYDETTVLDGANLEGSFFEKEFHDRGALGNFAYLNEHWADQVIWLDRLRASNAPSVSDAYRAFATFVLSEDPFVRRSALAALRSSVEPSELISIIESVVLDKDERALVAPSFRLLKSLYREHPQMVTQVVAGHLSGPWAAEAAIFLTENGARGNKLLCLSELISRHENAAVRTRFIAALAEREGLITEALVRDPITGDVFDYKTVISDETLTQITKKVRRAVDAVFRRISRGDVVGPNTREERRNLALSAEFHDAKGSKLSDLIKERIRAFSGRYNLKYRFLVTLEASTIHIGAFVSTSRLSKTVRDELSQSNSPLERD